MDIVSVDRFIQNGVTFLDAGSVRVAADAVIDEGVFVGANVIIGSGVRVRRGARILPFTVLVDTDVGEECSVGPFAHVHSGSVVGRRCRVGNFVEIKRSFLGEGVKVAHHAYVGDAYVGARCNLGCGVVFCNYNGRGKHAAFVGRGSFVGSNVNLVAPVTVGAGCFIAAGSTVTGDVPDGAFYVGCREGRLGVRGVRRTNSAVGNEEPR